MLKGKTETGFEFEIDEDVKDDMELLDAITYIDKGDWTYVTEVLDRLLGTEQKKKLYDHCRNEKGRAPASVVMQEVKNIFDAVGESESEVKN